MIRFWSRLFPGLLVTIPLDYRRGTAFRCDRSGEKSDDIFKEQNPGGEVSSKVGPHLLTIRDGSKRYNRTANN